jgi:hypothetical protein
VQYLALLGDAVKRLEARDGIAGWESLQAAQRVALGALRDDEPARRIAAALIAAEADEKLKEWRRTAAVEVLKVCPETAAPTVAQLREAQLQIDSPCVERSAVSRSSAACSRSSCSGS